VNTVCQSSRDDGEASRSLNMRPMAPLSAPSKSPVTACAM